MAPAKIEERGRERAAELLRRVTEWMVEERRRQRWHPAVARELAALARIGGFTEFTAAAHEMLLDAPSSAFSAGIITNIADLSAFVRRELPDAAESATHFPEYDDDVVLTHVQRMPELHIQLALEGRLGEAATHATTDLHAEEYASTCAVLGHIDAALLFIDREEFPAERRIGPLMVACIESHRRSRDVIARLLLARIVAADGRPPWPCLVLCAGFLGRVPWGGYPYSDY